MRATILPLEPKKRKAYCIDETTKEASLRIKLWKTRKVKQIDVTITAFERQPGHIGLVRIEGYTDDMCVTAYVNVNSAYLNDLGYAEVTPIHPQ